MAHEVEIRDGIASIAFAHETPWHGLGVKVDPNIKPEDMAKAARADWRVEKRPIFTTRYEETTADEIKGGVVAPGDLQQIGDKYALTRVTDGKVFDIVGANWNPVQNEEIFATFKHFVDEGGATMETAGVLKGGEIVWALANVGNGFVLPNGEPVKGYLLLASRHKAGFATIGRLTPVCVVCANTFAQSGGFTGAAQLRVPHTREFKADEAAQAIGIARAGMSEFETNARLLSKLNISRDDALRILQPVYQPDVEAKDLIGDFDKTANRTVKGIMEAALKGAGADLRGDTAWGVFNACTYYANHKARGTRDGRFASTLLGANNANLNKVFKSLVEMAD